MQLTNKYERKYKEAQPVLAICYDFDKTLSPDDMQAQGYIQSVGYEIAEFWKNLIRWQKIMKWIKILLICFV